MELSNALNWFEIPVENFGRAKKFYEALFQYEMPENQMGPARMGFFLYDFKEGKVGGAIVYRPGFHVPSATGCLIYLNAQPDLQPILDRVEPAGGKLLLPKTQISPQLGYQAFILDTEGNRVALHSMS
jgi:uncharacterized protein